VQLGTFFDPFCKPCLELGADPSEGRRAERGEDMKT